MSKHAAEALCWIVFWGCLFSSCSYEKGKKIDLEIERLKFEQKKIEVLGRSEKVGE